MLAHHYIKQLVLINILASPTPSKYLDFQFSSVQVNCSVMSDAFRLHELQHSRIPCPSPTPGVYLLFMPAATAALWDVPLTLTLLLYLTYRCSKISWNVLLPTQLFQILDLTQCHSFLNLPLIIQIKHNHHSQLMSLLEHLGFLSVLVTCVIVNLSY